MSVLKYHSLLDTERFGFKVAKVNSFDEPIKDILNNLKIDDYKLILSKVNTLNIGLINDLEENGFLLKDIQLTYKYEVGVIIPNKLADDLIIREANLSDKNSLYDIAIKSFQKYGHYASDNKLDSNTCKEIYGDWIIRSFEKQVADNILVAEVNGKIAGFLSHKIYENNFKYAVGGIGAVDPTYRNKDIFKAITISGLDWAFKNNCDWVEHNVLITNYPVNRSFSKVGFKISNSFITFHKWL
jgi:RimJ/RimL family protein N-acetyltransferase